MENQLNDLNIKLAELKTEKVSKNTKEYALAYYHKKNVPCVCVKNCLYNGYYYRHIGSKLQVHSN